MDAGVTEATVANDLPQSAGFHQAALLAEYSALKNEQTQRIVVRDTVLYISITANTAIAAIYQQQANPNARVLLAIPFISTLLFWLYATNDSIITQIRRYIIENISPRLSEGAGIGDGGLFGWEYWRRGGMLSRFLFRLIRLLVVWSTFSGASIAALIATAPTSRGVAHDTVWLAAAAFTALPYILGLWLIDL